MRSSIAALIMLLAGNAWAFAAGPSGQPLDWNPWRRLPVQDGGRFKPLDTLARETVLKITGGTSFSDPATGRKLDPVGLYLTMLFDWQGGEKADYGWPGSGTSQPPESVRSEGSSANASRRYPSTPATPPHGSAMMHSRLAYFESHQPDHWDRAPLIRVDSRLRGTLGLDKHQAYISPLELSKARIQDPHTDKEVSFLVWAGGLARNERKKLSNLEESGLELADRLWSYQDLRMGQALDVLPMKDNPDQQWLSVADLLRADLDEQTDPTGGLRKAKEGFRKVRAAYLSGSSQAFDQATAAFVAAVTEAGPGLGAYPRQGTIDLEVAYHRCAPFRLAWVLSSVAILCLLLSMAVRWRPFYLAGLTALGTSLVAMLIGFGVRTAISGRAPVTNLYESVVFMALGTLVFGLVFGLLSRKQHILTAAVAIGTIALILADTCPTVLNPSLRPLQPVLRSNFWLAVHVITIMLGYSALAVALGISNVTLGYYLVGSQKQETIQALSRFTYKSLQAGVLLLEVGTILGALWADYSWGRFWGWDPKEVWALITLLSYLAILHARSTGWVGNLGLAALSVFCFTWVMMAWYGVNFFHGGLHNYGLSGSTGALYVLGAVVAQLLYVTAAVAVALWGRSGAQVDRSAPQPA